MAEGPDKGPGTPPPKGGKRRKAADSRRRRPSDRTQLWALILLGIIVVLGVIGTVAFDDRHWQAFDRAGDVAFERGNYNYAERMYNEALQVAQDLDDDELVRTSLASLRQVQAAQERAAQAAAARAAAR